MFVFLPLEYNKPSHEHTHTHGGEGEGEGENDQGATEEQKVEAGPKDPALLDFTALPHINSRCALAGVENRITMHYSIVPAHCGAHTQQP